MGEKTDMLTWQIYSFTRVATLVMVAINIYNLDSTNPINCHVCATLFPRPSARPLIEHVPNKVTMGSQFVCILSHPIFGDKSLTPPFFPSSP